MSTKIAVISDLHVKNNSRHQEYREYFSFIKNKLNELCPEYILFCGDLFHSKTTLTPEAIFLAREFLVTLDSIQSCKRVFIILGNHDCNEKNLEKLDAISITIENTCNKTEFIRHTGIHLMPNRDVLFCGFSILDKDVWQSHIDHVAKINCPIKIGLYHGPLKGAKTDLGFVFTNHDDISKYDNFDFMFCGDIHSHYTYDGIGRKVSVGNPIQQDFGENTTKGFLFYEINHSHSFDYQFIQIPNFYPYITLNVEDDIPELEDSKKIRIRVLSNKSYDDTLKYIKLIKNKYKDKILSLSVSRKPESSSSNNNSNVLTYNDYVKNHPSKDTMISLYEKYANKINIKNNNINWKILSLKWNNLFSYSEDNHVDFQSYQGNSIGVFGENYSGKTSLIDVICFSLFGSWTKPFIKTVNFINDTKKYADSEVILQINNQTYRVYRKLEKSGKTSKSSIKFENISTNENLNQETVTDTQSLIEQYIGTKEQFMLTSLSTQYNNFSLLEEKNTKRKEYFSTFLGIDKYQEIHKIAKNDLDSLNNVFKFSKNSTNISELENNIKQLSEQHSELSQQLYNHVHDCELEQKIIESDTFNYEYCLNNLKDKRIKINYITEQINNATVQLSGLKIEDINLSQDDIDMLLSKQYQIKDLKSQISSIVSSMSQGKDKISALTTKKNNLLKLSNGLKDIPCGLKYPNCTYIAYAIKETEGFDELSYDNEINKLQEDIQNNKQNAQLINEKAQSLENEVKILQPKYEKYLKNKKEYELVNKLKDKIKDLNEELSIFKLDLENYENNVKKQLFYEFKDNLFEFIVDKIKEIKDKKTNILLLKEKIKNCKQSIQFTEFKINEIKKQIDDIEKAKSEICSLEDFCETVGKNGISVKILQDYIPEISALMNAVISNFADFSVELKIDDEKYLEIYLTDNVSTRLIESCSGSQKTIISYALRMALLSYAQIPSSNLFILDEPATSFDENHLLQFNKLLDMIKINNKTILLVTHISLLKDYVDTAFIVDRSSGYSKILS